MYRLLFGSLACALVALGCSQSEDVAQNNAPPAIPPAVETGTPSAESDAVVLPAGPPSLGLSGANVADPAAETPAPTELPASPTARKSGDDKSGQDKGGEKGAAAEEPKPKTAQDYIAEAQKHQRAGKTDDAIAALREAARLEPQNKSLALGLSQLIQQHAGQLAQTGELKRAYPMFVESAEIARKTIGDPKNANANEKKFLANVLYNEACGLAMTGDPAKALNSLREAFEAGFDDIGLANRDEDLTEVRKLPEFKTLVDEQTAKISQAARDEAKKLIAKQEAFPFDFELTDINDKPIKLADFKGKVTIVDFWGTWCPPCRMEIPHFVELQNKYKKDLQIVGLNYERVEGDAAKETIKKFVEDNGMNYPCAIGDEATQNQVPNLQGYPTTLFIDRTGKVRLQVVGYHPMAKLEGIVSELIDEKPAATETQE
jgi:thiol-disulfide isomerase/thioredoxin